MKYTFLLQYHIKQQNIRNIEKRGKTDSLVAPGKSHRHSHNTHGKNIPR